MTISKGLIGVIVPVYKVEKYIAECIESILAQTYTKFRLILVDDGTPDNAGKICDEYAKKDPRITVIHQENTGVTRARARGVEEAEDCEFITFVDSDDTITCTTLYELVTAISEEIDIVVSDFHGSFTNCSSISIEEYRHYLLAEKRISLAPWGKLFKRNLFDNFTFLIPRDITIGEDLIMNIRLSFKTEKSIRLINKHIYNYREYGNSTFHSHVGTIDYAQAWHEEKILSIPVALRNKYTTSTISARLLRFREIWGYKYIATTMKESKFYRNLESDIIKTKFKQPFIDNIIFKSNNCIIRYIAINIKKTFAYFQKRTNRE